MSMIEVDDPRSAIMQRLKMREYRGVEWRGVANAVPRPGGGDYQRDCNGKHQPADIEADKFLKLVGPRGETEKEDDHAYLDQTAVIGDAESLLQ